MVRLVQTYSVFKQIAKSICNEYSICFSSQNLPYSSASDFVKVCYAHPLRVRVPTTQSNKNSEADKYLLRYFGTPEGTRTPDLLVRSQSLYPAELPARNTLLNCKYALYTKTTVWFVASHSIQLSYRRIPQAVFACEQYYNTFLLKMQVFFT